MINCIIIDDEPLAQIVLETYIKSYDQLNLIATCNTAMQAIEVLHHQKIDLLFLDIKMPGLNGVEFIKLLKNPPSVIFTTAFPEFAVASYDLEAIDYLLKPVTWERFDKSLGKIFKLQPDTAACKQEDYTYFKVSRKLVKVMHADILYAQSIKDYIMLYSVNATFIIHMTMKYLTELLPSDTFFRVHRSYLINSSHIDSIGKKVLIKKQEIPIGESYKDLIRQLKEKMTRT